MNLVKSTYSRSTFLCHKLSISPLGFMVSLSSFLFQSSRLLSKTQSDYQRFCLF
uniref:Uncharacterized protein n=1 Tax=Podoviridae sp. ctlMy11 TaxID=2827746 RepID=A0A8S5TCH0_9CAUD|nr:MAG TPA: hypothetical protein [Podoviridae sp. ctlMy11]